MKKGDDWRTPTTYTQRFSDAVTLLCGGNRPPETMVAGWINRDSEELQAFAVQYGPSWAQGIGLIDAAELMANNPVEGVSDADGS